MTVTDRYALIFLAGCFVIGVLAAGVISIRDLLRSKVQKVLGVYDPDSSTSYGTIKLLVVKYYVQPLYLHPIIVYHLSDSLERYIGRGVMERHQSNGTTVLRITSVPEDVVDTLEISLSDTKKLIIETDTTTFITKGLKPCTTPSAYKKPTIPSAPMCPTRSRITLHTGPYLLPQKKMQDY